MSDKREKPHWEGKHYSFFQNTECEYFPCHRIVDPARFNCLFCYCPLYMLGPDCGGNFRYTEKGRKDCTGCLIPHLPENYGRITGKYAEIAAGMKKSGETGEEKAQGKRSTQGTPQDGEISAAKTQDTQSTQEIQLRSSSGRIVMMACTERGFETMRRAEAALAVRLPGAQILQTGHCSHVPGYENGPKLSDVAKQYFHEADALIFFTAAGIAVRCIAPFVQDKFRDPAVLVSDENGKYVISLMSGHAGGANRLSLVLAEALGAQPVITTATDGRNLFAVDVFAVEQGMQISDRTAAKQISARILAGEKLKIYTEDGRCTMPADSLQSRSREEETSCTDVHGIIRRYGEGICGTKDRSEADIIVSCRREAKDRKEALYLIPRRVTLGVGCRKGIGGDAVRKAVLEILRKTGVFRQAICGIASIDLKKDEQGLLAFAREWELPAVFYTAEELNALPGNFTASDFVRNITGVDCVCERSAVRLAMDYGCKQRSAPDRDTVIAQESGADQDAVTTQESWSDQDAVTTQESAIDLNCGDTQDQENAVESISGRVLLLEKKTSLDGVTTALALFSDRVEETP